MGRLSLKNRNIRKLFRVGGGKTYSITLPLENIKDFGWKQKQKLVVEADKKRKRFIIKDWKKNAR